MFSAQTLANLWWYRQLSVYSTDIQYTWKALRFEPDSSTQLMETKPLILDSTLSSTLQHPSCFVAFTLFNLLVWDSTALLACWIDAAPCQMMLYCSNSWSCLAERTSLCAQMNAIQTNWKKEFMWIWPHSGLYCESTGSSARQKEQTSLYSPEQVVLEHLSK